MKLALATSLLVLLATSSGVHSKDRNNKPHHVGCYFESWAGYSKNDAHFVAEDINPNVCTIINYSFAQLKDNAIALMDPDLDENGQHMIRRVVALRKHNPHLTVMISLGGWSEGSTKYSEMVRSEAHRKHFIQSVVKFLQAHDLDGLDLDWEYPAFSGVKDGDRRPGRAEDKHDYVTLLKELKEAFKSHGFILTAAVAAGHEQMERSYDMPALSKYLDFINVMSYDYNEGGHTSHNAPLSGHGETVHATIDYWLKHGTDPKKLLLGLPLYGKGYKLDNGNDHKVGAKGHEGGNTGGNYNHICKELKAGGWAQHWDDQAQVPYASKGNDWITYDNARSIQKKLEYVLEKKLGGSFVWPVDGDDFHGHCGEGKYPLMKLQMKTLNHVDAADVTIPHNH